MATYTLLCTGAAQTRSDHPNTNYHGSSSYWLQDGDIFLTFEGFTVSQLRRRNVVMGNLSVLMNLIDQNIASTYADIRFPDSAVDLTTITYNNAPETGYPNVGRLREISPSSGWRIRKYADFFSSDPTKKAQFLTSTHCLVIKQVNNPGNIGVYTGSEDSSELPEISVTISNLIPYSVTGTKNTSGQIDRTAANTFKWRFEATGSFADEILPAKQASAVFAWKDIDGGSEHRVSVSGATASVTIEANTLPQRGFTWYVSVTDEDGHIDTSETYTVYTGGIAPSVEISSPSDISLYGNKAIDFKWVITNGSGQLKGTQMRYSADNWQTYTTLVNSSGTVNAASATANSLPKGLIKWRVRVKGEHTGWTAWENASFTVLESLPVVSNLSPKGLFVYRTNACTLSWSASISYGSITGSELEYSTDNGSTWTSLGTVSGTETQYEVPANTLPASTAILWRVRSINGDNQPGDWASASLATIDHLMTAKAKSPKNNESMNEKAAITLTWTATNDLGSSPIGAELQWSTDNETWTDLPPVGGNACSSPIDADTFTGNTTIYWRVRAYNQSGNAGEWSESAQFSTVDETQYARPTAPISTIEDMEQLVLFTWENSSSSGAAASEYKLQVSYDGGSNWTTYTSAAKQAAIQISAAGNVTWRVCARNRNAYGPWSENVSFVAYGASPVSSFTTNDVPCTTFKWEVSNQQAYRLTVDGREYGPYFGDADRQYTLYEPLANGEHTATISIQNDFGLWSDPTTETFTVENRGNGTIELFSTTDLDAELQWEARISPYNHSYAGDWLIYRDGKLIGRTAQASVTFTDRHVLGTHDYYVLYRYKSGMYVVSNGIEATMATGRDYAIAAFEGGEWIRIQYTLKDKSDPEWEDSRGVAYDQMAGNEYPTPRLSSFYSSSGVYSAGFRSEDKEQHAAFRALFGKPVILKTPDDTVHVGILDSWKRKVRTEHYTEYSFTIQRIDWRDFKDGTN